MKIELFGYVITIRKACRQEDKVRRMILKGLHEANSVLSGEEITGAAIYSSRRGSRKGDMRARFFRSIKI